MKRFCDLSEQDKKIINFLAKSARLKIAKVVFNLKSIDDTEELQDWFLGIHGQIGVVLDADTPKAVNCLQCSNLKIMDKRCASELEPYYCLKYQTVLDFRYTDEEFPEIEPCEECEQQEQKLKPCPFCGSRTEIWEHDDYELYWAECTNLECEISTRSYGTTEQAIAAWNRRT